MRNIAKLSKDNKENGQDNRNIFNNPTKQQDYAFYLTPIYSDVLHYIAANDAALERDSNDLDIHMPATSDMIMQRYIDILRTGDRIERQYGNAIVTITRTSIDFRRVN